MRVLLDVSAVPARPVGAGVYTISLAERLARRVDVDLVLLCRRDDAGRWHDLAPGSEVRPSAPPRRAMRLAWEQVAGARQAAGVDVWHGPHYTMPWRNLPVPAVVTVHDLTFFDHPEWHERTKVSFFRHAIARSAARARVLITPSEVTTRRLHRVLAPRAEVVTVPHGVDHERFCPDPDDRLEAADLAVLRTIGVRPPYVAFAGTLEPRKDVPTLVRAFARIGETRPELRLVLAGGDGWGTVAARHEVERSGVATRVLRPGYVPADALPALFRRAAVVAYPSLEEGFGLPVLEALACGAPVITTAGTAMAEVAGGAALHVAAGDEVDLAAGLTRVLDDDALTNQLHAAGPPQASGFTWSRSASAHVEAYRAAASLDRVAGS